MSGLSEAEYSQGHYTPYIFPWEVTIFAFLFGCVTLWDFFIGEIRIFDFIGILFTSLFLTSMVMTGAARALQVERRTIATVAALFGLVFCFVLIGIQAHPDNLKPSIGMLLGVLILILTRCVVLEDKSIDRPINVVAWIHILTFFYQLIFFYITKEVINYHAVVGLQPRLVASVFRPAGLFLEPAIYCFFACSIFFLRRQREQAFNVLDSLIILSMLLSLSLWGISIAFFLLCIFRIRIVIFAAIALLIATLFTLSTQDLSHSLIYQFLKMRLTNLGSDPSTQGRYGGTFDWLFGLLANPTILFGNGINNFFEEHGTNGWAFILNSMGLIGTSILFVLFALLAPPRRWILFGVAFAILLTAAPLWKTFYFWCWIALMLRPSSSGISQANFRASA